MTMSVDACLSMEGARVGVEMYINELLGAEWAWLTMGLLFSIVVLLLTFPNA